MIALTASNYHTWKCKMEDLLYINQLHLPVFATEKPEDMTEEQWTLLHRKVCGYIRQWVDDNVLNHISEEKHAQTLWKKLEQLYARKTGQNKMFLIKQLMSLRYRDGTPLRCHFEIFQGIINQLAGTGIKFDDEIQGLCLLATLPDSWETFRLLSYSAPNGVMNMDLAKSSILNEEMRRKSDRRFLLQKEGGQSKVRDYKSKSNRFATAECYECGEKGHIRKYCRQLKF